MDEIKLGQQQALGAKARDLLDSEAFKVVFSYLEDEFIHAWRRCKEDQPAARERLWTSVRCLDLIKVNLGRLVENGKLATKDLANIKYFKR